MSSKLSNLKQQAYQAGKRRNWAEAIAVYEQILDLDKNNPALINELGDICLKNGQVDRSLRHFLNAASKYKTTGLLNNAVAVYKKVLRHDEENLNAHWFLAEIRSSQGLIVEGQRHAEHFLAAAQEVSGEFKEIFLKRCGQLLGLYTESEVVLERLLQAFRHWDLKLETARTGCLLACRLHRAGEKEEANSRIEKITAECPDVVKYSEYSRWQQVTGEAPTPDEFADVNSIDLVESAPPAPAAEIPTAAESVPATPAPEPAATTPPETPATPAPAIDTTTTGDAKTPFDDLIAGVGEIDGDEPEPLAEERPITEATDEEGCIAIDVDDGASLSDLVQEAAASVDETKVPDLRGTGSEPDEKVDLLQEILRDSGEDLAAGAAAQLDTIAAEIGSRVGGEDGPQDAETLYQQGLVYLDMALYDQAATTFEELAAHPEYALRACEMGGIALLRAGQHEAALAVFTQGLGAEGVDPTETVGLLYYAGRALELLERHSDAHERFSQVQAIDPGFLDVGDRVKSTVC